MWHLADWRRIAHTGGVLAVAEGLLEQAIDVAVMYREGQRDDLRIICKTTARLSIEAVPMPTELAGLRSVVLARLRIRPSLWTWNLFRARATGNGLRTRYVQQPTEAQVADNQRQPRGPAVHVD